MSINKIMLIGNCAADPKIMTTQDGREIASFSLGTSEYWKNKQGEKQQKTEWHKVVCFSQGLTGIIKSYVKKGSKLYVEGKIQTRKYKDKDGIEKYVTEVVLQGFDATLQLLDSKKQVDQHNQDKANAYQKDEWKQVEENFELDDSVPF